MSESVFYGYVVIDYSLLRIINHLVSDPPRPPPSPHRIILHSQVHVCVEQCCPLLVELLSSTSLIWGGGAEQGGHCLLRQPSC